MKIGVISDIHANIYGLRSVLPKLKGTELILCAGDITGYYPFVNEVFDELEKYNVIFVKGNHDAYLCGDLVKDSRPIEPKSIAYTREHITDINLYKLKNMPIEQDLEFNSVRIAMFHGSPWDKLEEYIYPDFPDFDRFQEVDADVIILGHTHYPMIKQIGERLVINPGSCGQPRDYNPKASLAVLDTLTRKVRIERVPYDVEKVCEAVRKLGFDSKLIDILKRTKHNREKGR